MGGDPVDRVLGSGAEISDWFRSGGDPEVAAGLEAQLRDRMPDLTIRGAGHMACVTTFTPEDEARIEMVSDRVGVATAGCGRGAKCSDELGRLGAVLIADDVPEGAPAMA